MSLFYFIPLHLSLVICGLLQNSRVRFIYDFKYFKLSISTFYGGFFPFCSFHFCFPNISPFSLRLLMRVMLETTHIEISFCFSSIAKQLQNTKQNLAKNAKQFQLIFFLNLYVFLPLSEINRKQPVMVTLIVHEFFHWPCFVLQQDYLT